MASVDVRVANNERVDKIIFGDNLYLQEYCSDTLRIRSDETEEEIDIHIDNLDNLILALKKAKELWFID